MTPEARALLEPAGTKVRDPISNRSIWLAGLLTEGQVQDDKLTFAVDFSKAHKRDDRARIVEALLSNLRGTGFQGEIEPTVRVEGVRRGLPTPKPPSGEGHGHDHGHSHDHKAQGGDKVQGMSGPGMQPHGGPIELTPIPGVKHIIAVASGKGGVGKSTVATNLAVSLAADGYLVGLMDSDIYGPSLPLMMGVTGKPIANEQRKILPLMAYGVKCMSIGFLVDETEPIIWRGPMVMGVVRQFLQEVQWAPLDYLVIDLPPGTGDAQLTLVQNVPISGSVIVTTPQDVALLDARRGVEMFRKLEVPVLGVVENMAWFELPDGTRAYPFGQGGGQRMADEFGVDLLGQIALDSNIRAGGDSGSPISLDEESAAALTFAKLAGAVSDRLPV
jgi:ATP-binding protein involved in chromosome partitioning